jgi:hypothetical protein
MVMPGKTGFDLHEQLEVVPEGYFLLLAVGVC